MNSPLTAPVEHFIAAVIPPLLNLASATQLAGDDKLRNDVALEAFNIAAGFIDCDGRHSDDELWAFVAVFAGRFDTVAWAASPTNLRDSGLLAGKRAFLDKPSALFQLLLAGDARAGSVDSWTYFGGALDIAQAVCAIDTEPSTAKLTAVERFRSVLLDAMDAAGVPRPGSPRPARQVSGPAAAAAAAASTPKAPEAEDPVRPLDDLLAELDGLVGLAEVKAEVKLVTNLVRVEKLRKERGLPVVEQSHHLVFTGNPGTGKTTVARLVAQIYRTLGVVGKGHLVETDRSGLVAGYVGQTAIKVREVFEAAMGGVLLIDEAHALARGGGERDFGQEAIDMLVKLMEDHRDEIVVIVAGYAEEMVAFLDANPGLRSRFPKSIFFQDYSNDELVQIFEGMCTKNRYTPTASARERVRAYVAAQPRDRGFGNARLVRNLFEACISRQASRVVELADVSDDALVTFEAADVPDVTSVR